MKKLPNIAGLMFCLMVFLSSFNLQAQQYKVDVILGEIECENVAQPGLTISGSLTAALNFGGSGAQWQNFVSKENGTNLLVYSKTFDFLPDYLLYASFTSPEGIDCGNGFNDNHFSLTPNQGANLGTQHIYNVTGDLGEDLELLVTVTAIGLITPGQIGPNQTICIQESPGEIMSITPATGGTGITYGWQYADAESGPWMDVHVDPNDPSSDLVETASYTPPSITADRWYRRSATLGAVTVVTQPVKISLTTASVEQYRMEFYLGEYQCSSQSYDRDFLADVFVDGVSFSHNGPSGDLVTPLFTHDFASQPQSITVNTMNSIGEEIPGEPLCTGDFLATETITNWSGNVIEYTMNNGSGSGESLKFHVRITTINPGAIAPGTFDDDDQTICENTAFINIVEDNLPGGSAPYAYLWQYRTVGQDWANTGVTSSHFPGTTLTEDTWYRRIVYSGCQSGISAEVKITVVSPDLSITGHQSEYAPNDPAVTLTGTPSGGVFSGPGMTGSVFSPVDAGPGLHTIIYTYTSTAPQSCVFTSQVLIRVQPGALCSAILPTVGSGQFRLDDFSGKIIYEKSDGCSDDIAYNCIGTQPNPQIIENVISANAFTLKDEWDYTPFYELRYETSLAQANSFEEGIKGKWRAKSQFQYLTDEVNRDKNYNTGTFDMPPFNWRYESANDENNWVEFTRTEKYTPNGEAIEEFNAIDIAQSVKMGYYENLPYLVSQNATYSSVFFESFEMEYGTQGILESGGEKIGVTDLANIGHAGFQSLMLTTSQGITTPNMEVASNGKVVMVQVWIRGALNEQLTATMSSTTGSTTIDSSTLTEVARSGDWGLYQAYLDPSASTGYNVNVTYNGAATIWLDDMKVQPFDAEVICYVYDKKSQRLLTTFDNEHFGLYYQYDGEGNLTRKTIETERGSRTLVEAFYNFPKVDKTGN